MDIITYIILGIIQGITEPIPVSSSGHIFLFKNLFNTNMFNSLNFEIISNFGSFIAIFIQVLLKYNLIFYLIFNLLQNNVYYKVNFLIF